MSDLDPELERLFRAARREEDPTDEDRRAVRSGLAERLMTAAAAGAAVTLATKAGTAAAGTAVKASLFIPFVLGLAAGAVVGGAVTATVLYRDSERAPEPVPSASAVRHTVPAPMPVPPHADELPAPSVSASAAATSGPLPRLEKPAPLPSAEPPEVPSLEVESRALGEVQRALRDGRAGEALRLLAEQDKTFALGALHEERAAARVLALCGAGRADEGRAARDRFLAMYPRSPAAARVRSSCAQ